MKGANQLSIFVPINKIDEEQRLVYGTVAAEEVDNSGETFDYEGSKPFFQKWSDNAYATSGGKSHGNLRVMHTNKVAGLLSSPLGFNDTERRIECCAKVVDDDEWKKVQTGCYTGFSMGGRYVSRATKGDTKSYIADPVEVSLVDKPCIRSATFEVIKADGVIEHREFHPELLKGHEDQPRDDHGRWASGGGGGSDQHGGSDPSGHGSTGAKGSTGEASPSGSQRGYVAVATVGPNSYKGSERQGQKNVIGGVYPTAQAALDAHNSWASSVGVQPGVFSSVEAEHTDNLPSRTDITNKADAGEAQMTYVPTNDELAARAETLAKASGVEGAAALDYFDAAREAIMAEHAGDPVVKADVVEQTPEEIAAAAELAKKDNPFADKGKKGGAHDPDNADCKCDKCDGASKADTGTPPNPDDGLSQVWQSKDGQTFAKKSEAMAHNLELAKADNDPVALLKGLVDEAQKIGTEEVQKSTFADPANDKYPIDNETEIRAAWSYIHMPKNDKEYSSEEVSAIESKIVAAWKEKIDPKGPPEADAKKVDVVTNGDVFELAKGAIDRFTPFTGHELVKGMYAVSRLATIIESLGYLQESVSWEQKAEGDTSTLPEMLFSGLKTLGETLVTMATEEVAEIIARHGAPDVGDSPIDVIDIMELAVAATGLEKADLIAKVEPLRKVAEVATDERLAKFDEVLADNTLLKTQIAEVVPLVKTMQAELERIRALPMPPISTRVVEKGADTGAVAKSDVPGIVLGPDGRIDVSKSDNAVLADAAIRMAHANPANLRLPAHGQ